MPAEDLKAVFLSFASYGTREPCSVLDGPKFTKLCKDCGLVKAPAFTPTDCDLIFAKVKAKTDRKITFEQFAAALDLIAQKKKTTKEAIEAEIVKSGGPMSNATKADAVKFHDDKSLYTGVYANGGPKAVDGHKVADLSQLTNRKAADVRGVTKH